MLAEVVAKPHLRKPRSEIIRLTHEARTKRTLLLDTPLPVPEPQVEDSDITTFLRMLDGRSHGLARRSHEARESTRDKPDTDLERILEESRQEYQAEQQLQEGVVWNIDFLNYHFWFLDIEKAKAESMLSPAHEVTHCEPSDWLRRLDNNCKCSFLCSLYRCNTMYIYVDMYTYIVYMYV